MLKNGSVVTGDEVAQQRLSPVVLVSGPTGAGKSSFALGLAAKLNGEIINIDSVQVYRGLNIGSAKLMPDKRRGIPHHLIDILDPDQRFDVLEYVERAMSAIREIQSRKKLAIIVGGTTMYVTALFHGLADLPKADEKLRQELDKLSNEELFENLKQHDLASAQRLHLNDRVRVIRALESAMLSGKSASQSRGEHGFRSSVLRGIMLILHRPRAELYADINQRAVQMIQDGILDEVSKLLERYSEDIRPLSTIGYKETVMCLKGVLAHENLAEEIALQTRHLAKRQMTYWRNEPAKRGWGVSQRPRTDAQLFADLSRRLSDAELAREVWHLL